MATKTIPQILRDNICTVFNLLNLTIAIALAAVGAWKNILFLLVILINTVMGIVQEIKAKRQIQRLTLLARCCGTARRSASARRTSRPETCWCSPAAVRCELPRRGFVPFYYDPTRNSFFPKLYRAFCHTTF